MNKLLINEEPLIILPSLASAIGLNDALFLQQIHYWCNRSKHIKNGSRWIYNTYEEWGVQFPFWSESTIKRTIKDLKDRDLIKIDRFNKVGYDRTNWYTVNYEVLNKLTAELFPDEDLTGIDTIEDPDEEPAPEKKPKKAQPKQPAVKHDQNSDPEFLEFWELYPKKAGKKEGYKSFKRARKEHDQSKIIMGTVGYAKVMHINKTDPQYIKNASTFLNNDSFLDYLNLTPDPTDEPKRPKQMMGIGEM